MNVLKDSVSFDKTVTLNSFVQEDKLWHDSFYGFAGHQQADVQ